MRTGAEPPLSINEILELQVQEAVWDELFHHHIKKENLAVKMAEIMKKIFREPSSVTEKEVSFAGKFLNTLSLSIKSEWSTHQLPAIIQKLWGLEKIRIMIMSEKTRQDIADILEQDREYCGDFDRFLRKFWIENNGVLSKKLQIFLPELILDISYSDEEKIFVVTTTKNVTFHIRPNGAIRKRIWQGYWSYFGNLETL